MDFSHLREDYEGKPIQTVEDPLLLLSLWMDEAEKSGLRDPNAFVLATATPSGSPSTRTVLLKEAGPDGLIFFTNLESRKAKEIEINPSVAGVFLHTPLSRQILIEGKATRCSLQKSESYFASRPLLAKISAWASNQGKEIPSRQELEERFSSFEAKFSGKEIPCPPYWGGFQIQLTAIEFWQGMPSRLHDRLRYKKEKEGWLCMRLMP